MIYYVCVCFFFQAEDGIRDLVRSRGLGDVYKRQEERGHRLFGDDKPALHLVRIVIDGGKMVVHIVDDLSLIHI